MQVSALACGSRRDRASGCELSAPIASGPMFVEERTHDRRKFRRLAVDAAAGEAALTAFEDGPWGHKYPAIGQSWRRAWGEVIPFYAFPGDVRRILYTTNAIEALNSKLRRAVRARRHFPGDEAATKLLFLVLNRSEKEWIMPRREWCMTKAQFAVLFGDRFTRAMA
jgi:putative transposase